MHRIQLGVHGIGGERREGIDFAISLHTGMDAGIKAGDVRIYTTNNRADGMRPELTSPLTLEPYIRQTLQPGLRVMIGNAGGELTFRHVYRYPRPNVRELLRWAEESFRLVGRRLVLAPMDFDIVDDVSLGGPLLSWCAGHGVPLAVFCGYRFLFAPGETGTMQGLQKKYPMDGPPGWAATRSRRSRRRSAAAGRKCGRVPATWMGCKPGWWKEPTTSG